MNILGIVSEGVTSFASNKEQFWARADRMQQVRTRIAALSVVDNTAERLQGGKLVRKGEKECRRRQEPIQSETKRNRGNHDDSDGPVDRLFRHRSRVPDVTLNV